MQGCLKIHDISTRAGRSGQTGQIIPPHGDCLLNCQTPCISKEGGSRGRGSVDGVVREQFCWVHSGGRVVSVRRRVHKPFCASSRAAVWGILLVVSPRNVNARVSAIDVVSAFSANVGTRQRITTGRETNASRDSRNTTVWRGILDGGDKEHPRHLLLTLTRSSQQWVSSSGTELKIVPLRRKVALADVVTWIALCYRVD